MSIGMPYSEPWEQCGRLHVSALRPCYGVACVVGKGVSIVDYAKVEADVFLTVNDACYAVKRQHFAVRGDGNIPDARFMDWLPHYSIPMMPERLKDYYGYGYWFDWTDIGLVDICLTTLMAIRLAHHVFKAERIVCVGLDSFYQRDSHYHRGFLNSRNVFLNGNSLGHHVRAKSLGGEILSKCSHYGWDGDFLRGID